MSTLATSMDSLNQSVQQLNTTMSALGETSIGLTATHTVNVNMNGAEMLAKIEPVMKQIAIDAVEKGIAARMTDTGETIEKPGGSNIASSTK